MISDKEWQAIAGTVDVQGACACETVNIVSKDAPGGFIVINKSDLQPTDKLYAEK